MRRESLARAALSRRRCRPQDLLPQLDVRLGIYTTGATFEDSTLEKLISTDSFTLDGLLGACSYRLIRGPTVHDSLCHTIQVHQRGALIANK